MGHEKQIIIIIIIIIITNNHRTRVKPITQPIGGLVRTTVNYNI